MKIRQFVKNLSMTMAMVGLVLLVEAAQGQISGNDNGFLWLLNGDGASISIYGYNGAGGAVAIPGMITVNPDTGALPVTGIAASAFQNRASLTGVTIPDSVTNIGSWVFRGCGSLTNVTIGDGVISGSAITTIAESAFTGCTNLTSVILGNNVSGTGNGPFFDFFDFLQCPLTTVAVLNGVTSIGNGTFAYCTGLTNLIIPNSVISIGDNPDDSAYYSAGAFEGCTNLSHVTLGTGLTSIGTSVFSGCTALLGIMFPDGLNNIGEEAFEGCTGLTNIAIPDNLTNIGASAFQGCIGLTNAGIGDGNLSATATITLGESAFSDCTNLVSFILGNNTIDTGFEPFYGCPLNQVTILNGVTSLGDGTFAYCTGLTNIIIPDSVVRIGDSTNNSGYGYGSGSGLFQGCTNLASVTFGTAVANIGNSAFSECTGLPGIVIPNSVTNVGPGAFQDCLNLTNVAIGTNVISIGNNAFFGCTGLATVAIPDSVISIGSEAFMGCSRLTSATIGAGVTNLGTGAFASYPVPGGVSEALPPPINPLPPIIAQPPTEINPVTVSDKATSVGSGLAAPSSSLTNITVVPANPAYSSLNGVLFNQRQTTLVQFPCGLGGNYAIPGTVATVGPEAFISATRLTSVTIPNGVISLGNNPFSGCASLVAITVAARNPAYTSANGVLFDKKLKTLLEYPQGLAGSYAIPATVANIANFAFNDCLKLTGVTLPNEVTNIGNSSFAYCSSLSKLVIPANVRSIGSEAFTGCAGLMSVSIPNRVNRLGNYVFWDCVLLANLPLPADLSNIPNGAFWGCTNLASVTIPAGVTNIGWWAFAGCAGLTNVVFSNRVTSIGEAAFENCTALTSIVIPNRVTDIGPLAFSGSGLTDIVIPNSVTNLEDDAFSNCGHLTAITIPNNVTNIGWNAFGDCTNLTEAFFQGNVPFVGFGNDWFMNDARATVYYLPGTSGWGTNFNGVPAVMANPTLTVLTNGVGTLAPNYNGALLMLGTPCTLTATPAPGFKFLDWTGGTNQPLVMLTNGPGVRFVMQLNLVLQANFAETNRPTVAITAPTAGHRVANALVNVTGTARDVWQVAGVWCQLNDGPWQLTQSANHWTNWNTTVALAAGANTISVYAVNRGGNLSTTNSVTVVSGKPFKLNLKLEPPQSRLTDGLGVTVETSANLAGHIEYSTDLIHWLYWTNFNGANAVMSFHDPAATNGVRRFYRAVVP